MRQPSGVFLRHAAVMTDEHRWLMDELGLGRVAEQWAKQGITTGPTEAGPSGTPCIEVRQPDGAGLLGYIEMSSGRDALDITYYVALIPNRPLGDSPTAPMPTGFMPPWPVRAAHDERIRWAPYIAEVTVPAGPRPPAEPPEG